MQRTVAGALQVLPAPKVWLLMDDVDAVVVVAVNDAKAYVVAEGVAARGGQRCCDERHLRHLGA